MPSSTVDMVSRFSVAAGLFPTQQCILFLATLEQWVQTLHTAIRSDQGISIALNFPIYAEGAAVNELAPFIFRFHQATQDQCIECR